MVEHVNEHDVVALSGHPDVQEGEFVFGRVTQATRQRIWVTFQLHDREETYAADPTAFDRIDEDDLDRDTLEGFQITFDDEGHVLTYLAIPTAQDGDWAMLWTVDFDSLEAIEDGETLPPDDDTDEDF